MRYLTILFIAFLSLTSLAQNDKDRAKSMKEHEAKVEAAKKKLKAQNPNMDIGQLQVSAEEIVQREEDRQRQAADNQRRIEDESRRAKELAEQKANEKAGKEKIPVAPINPETNTQDKQVRPGDEGKFDEPKTHPTPNANGQRAIDANPSTAKKQAVSKVKEVEQRAAIATTKQEEAKVKIAAAKNRVELQYKNGEIKEAEYQEKLNRIKLATERVAQSEEIARAAKLKADEAKQKIK